MTKKLYLGRRVDLAEAKIAEVELVEIQNFPDTVTIDCSEFTCRCPVTSQPDYATIQIQYSCHGQIIETKSLKLFLERYREQGIFHEQFTAELCSYLFTKLRRSKVTVKTTFNRRGGMAVTSEATLVPR